MKKNILVLLLSTIAFIIISISKVNCNIPSSNDEILPLKVGNYWKYDMFHYDTLGNVTYQELRTEKIISDTMIINDRFYMVSNEIQNKIDKVLISSRTDGVYSYEAKVINFILKYPANKGDKFNSIKGIMTVESTNYNYVTNIGNFSCYQYSWGYSDIKHSIYFKPGDGYVAYEYFYYTNSGRLFLSHKIVLKEYKVN